MDYIPLPLYPLHPLSGKGGLELRTLIPQLAERWLNSPSKELLRLGSGFSDLLWNVMMVHQVLSAPDTNEETRCMEGTEHCTLQKFLLAPGRTDPCHPQVSIAISSALDFCRGVMIWAGMKVTGQVISDIVRLGHSGVFQWRSPTWAELIHRGWCPFELTPMSVRFNTAGLTFISLIERPVPSRFHKTAAGYPWAGHSSQQDPQCCSSFSCVHRQLIDETYSTAHAAGCQTCPTLVARLEDISAILLGDSFPLIAPVNEMDDIEHIQPVPWQPRVRFVAISHVWSDGPGNVRENGVPKCQLLVLVYLYEICL